MRAGHYKQSYAELVALTDSGAVKVWTGALIAGLVALPFLVGPYALSLATVVAVTVVGVVGLNLLTGVCGLISLGHAGFMAIGAYTAAVLAVDAGASTVPAVVAGGAAAAASSLLVGVPSLRLKGLYLAITTLAFTVIATHVILNAEGLTRGSAGLFLPVPDLFGLPLASGAAFYLVALLFAAGSVLAALNLMRTRVGRAFAAIRDQDTAAEMMGVDLTRTKLLAFALSAFFTGVSGALLAFHIRYINVDSFALLVSIEALAMIIVGGLGSIAGAVLGTVFMVLLPEAIRIAFDLFGSGLREAFATRALEVRGLIYGLVIILVLRFQPEGLVGLWRETRRIWSNWPFRY